MSESKRAHERYERQIPVAVISEDGQLDGVTRNISLGGMFIAVPSPVKFGSAVRVRFRLPSLKEETELAATVRWVTPDGIGVQFGSLRAIEVWGLNQLFKGG